jgi:hypothetical protein
MIVSSGLNNWQLYDISHSRLISSYSDAREHAMDTALSVHNFGSGWMTVASNRLQLQDPRVAPPVAQISVAGNVVDAHISVVGMHVIWTTDDGCFWASDLRMVSAMGWAPYIVSSSTRTVFWNSKRMGAQWHLKEGNCHMRSSRSSRPKWMEPHPTQGVSVHGGLTASVIASLSTGPASEAAAIVGAASAITNAVPGEYQNGTVDVMGNNTEHVGALPIDPANQVEIVSTALPAAVDDPESWKRVPIPRGPLCRISPDGIYFAAAIGNHVRIFGSTSMELIGCHREHTAPIISIAWHPTWQNTVISTDADANMQTWTFTIV